jgi:hypothetical protein
MEEITPGTYEMIKLAELFCTERGFTFEVQIDGYGITLRHKAGCTQIDFNDLSSVGAFIRGYKACELVKK